jgi:hypothetical protein
VKQLLFHPIHDAPTLENANRLQFFQRKIRQLDLIGHRRKPPV